MHKLQVTLNKIGELGQQILTNFQTLLFQNSIIDEETKLIISAEIDRKIILFLSEYYPLENTKPKKTELRNTFLSKQFQCLKVCSINNNIRYKDFYLYIIWEKLKEPLNQLFQQFAKSFEIIIAFGSDQLYQAIEEQIKPLRAVYFEGASGNLIQKLDDFKNESTIRAICQLKNKESKKLFSHIVQPKYNANIAAPCINYTEFYNTININSQAKSMFKKRVSLTHNTSRKALPLSYNASPKDESVPKKAYWPIKMNRTVFRCFSESLTRKTPVSLLNLKAVGSNPALKTGLTPRTIWVSPYLTKVKLTEIKGKCRLLRSHGLACTRLKIYK